MRYSPSRDSSLPTPRETPWRPAVVFVAQPRALALLGMMECASRGWSATTIEDASEAASLIAAVPPDVVIPPLRPEGLPLEKLCELVRQRHHARSLIVAWGAAPASAPIGEVARRCGADEYVSYDGGARGLCDVLARWMPSLRETARRYAGNSISRS